MLLSEFSFFLSQNWAQLMPGLGTCQFEDNIYSINKCRTILAVKLVTRQWFTEGGLTMSKSIRPEPANVLYSTAEPKRWIDALNLTSGHMSALESVYLSEEAGNKLLFPPLPVICLHEGGMDQDTREQIPMWCRWTGIPYIQNSL